MHALDHVDIGHDGTHLVLLQVTDEVPADVLGQLGRLDDKFLGAAFTEPALSCVIGLLQFLDGVELGDGNQSGTRRQLLVEILPRGRLVSRPGRQGRHPSAGSR